MEIRRFATQWHTSDGDGRILLRLANGSVQTLNFEKAEEFAAVAMQLFNAEKARFLDDVVITKEEVIGLMTDEEIAGSPTEEESS